MRRLRIAMLHLAPVTADVAHNRRLAERGLARAAEMGAQWVITPELFITGYKFAEVIGTDWIRPQPDEWMQEFCRRVAECGVTVFLSHPERDAEAGLMYNTVFVIGPDGRIIGRHRKVKALRGPEAWSSPGAEIAPIVVPVGRGSGRNGGIGAGCAGRDASVDGGRGRGEGVERDGEGRVLADGRCVGGGDAGRRDDGVGCAGEDASVDGGRGRGEGVERDGEGRVLADGRCDGGGDAGRRDDGVGCAGRDASVDGEYGRGEDVERDGDGRVLADGRCGGGGDAGRRDDGVGCAGEEASVGGGRDRGEDVERDGGAGHVAVGVVICADAYRNDVAGTLQERGARLLVSPASWGPGDCGPLGEWEQRTLDTGLPIMVCNRSGWEADDLDFNEAVSVVALNGERALEAYCGEESAALVFDWDLDGMAPLSEEYEVAWL